MPLSLRRGAVTAVLERHDGLVRLEVDGVACIAYPLLTGPVALGDEVVIGGPHPHDLVEFNIPRLVPWCRHDARCPAVYTANMANEIATNPLRATVSPSPLGAKQRRTSPTDSRYKWEQCCFL